MHQVVAVSVRAVVVSCVMWLAVSDRTLAQTNQPAATQALPGSQADQLRQVTLTEKMIEGVLASQKEFDTLAEKAAPEGTADKPDAKVAEQFNAVAKKYGFASYDEYSDALDTISVVLSGFDPKTKKYVGVQAVIKQQIAAIQADKAIPAEDKKQVLDQLNDALKGPAPTIENKANIDLVEKYYDKISAAMQEDE